jgi:hypothetical protein
MLDMLTSPANSLGEQRRCVRHFALSLPYCIFLSDLPGFRISREYAGTSALKGDFVRSGKRNWLGQFNDATNSVARFWQNTILDFFKQAMIDYVTGVNTNAFLDFSEKMQTSDPGEITRLASIRQSASKCAHLSF